MKPILLAVVFGIFSNLLFGQYPVLQWANSTEAWMEHNPVEEESMVDANGNVYNVLYIDEVTDVDPGPGVFNLGTVSQFQYILQKLDSNGDFLWAHEIPTPTLMWLKTFDDLGNIYVIGRIQNIGTYDIDPGPAVVNRTSSSASSYYMMKLDPNGNHLYDLFFDSPIGISDRWFLEDVKVNSDGSIYLWGKLDGSMDVDPGTGISMINGGVMEYKMVVAKIDANGDLIWHRYWDYESDIKVDDFEIDSNGDLHFMVTCYGVHDLDPSPGNYVFNGNGMSVIKLNSNGQFIDVVDMDIDVAQANLQVLEFRLNSQSDYIFYGSCDNANTMLFDFDAGPGSFNIELSPFSESEESFILQYSSNGLFEWVRTFESYMNGNYVRRLYSEMINDIEIDGNDNIHFIGSVAVNAFIARETDSLLLQSIDSSDVLIGKLSSTGDLEYAFTIGGLQDDIGLSCDLGLNDDFYAIGSFEETGDFDPNSGVVTLNSTTQNTVFNAKFDAALLSLVTNKKNKILIYPNPTQDQFQIRGIKDKSEVLIFDMNGRLLRDLKVKSDQIIDVSNFSPGMYLIKVREGNQEFNERIIIE